MSIEENEEEGNIDTSGVRVEPMPEVTIEELRDKLRFAITDYRLACPKDYPCDANVLAYVYPSIGLKAKKANEIAHKLRDLDRTMPAWTDLPVGVNLMSPREQFLSNLMREHRS